MPLVTTTNALKLVGTTLGPIPVVGNIIQAIAGTLQVIRDVKKKDRENLLELHTLALHVESLGEAIESTYGNKTTPLPPSMQSKLDEIEYLINKIGDFYRSTEDSAESVCDADTSAMKRKVRAAVRYLKVEFSGPRKIEQSVKHFKEELTRKQEEFRIMSFQLMQDGITRLEGQSESVADGIHSVRMMVEGVPAIQGMVEGLVMKVQNALEAPPDSPLRIKFGDIPPSGNRRIRWTANVLPKNDLSGPHESIKSNLCADVRQFLRSRKQYKREGIEWRRGYLLHGPKRSGKRTLVKEIAAELGFHTFCVSLMGQSWTDETLKYLTSHPPPQTFLVFEDLETSLFAQERPLQFNSCQPLLLTYDQTKQEEEDAVNSTLSIDPYEQSDVTLSGFIDAMETEGRIFFATTEDMTAIHPDLYQVGRFDVHVVVAAPHDRLLCDSDDTPDAAPEPHLSTHRDIDVQTDEPEKPKPLMESHSDSPPKVVDFGSFPNGSRLFGDGRKSIGTRFPPSPDVDDSQEIELMEDRWGRFRESNEFSRKIRFPRRFAGESPDSGCVSIYGGEERIRPPRHRFDSFGTETGSVPSLMEDSVEWKNYREVEIQARPEADTRTVLEAAVQTTDLNEIELASRRDVSSINDGGNGETMEKEAHALDQPDRPKLPPEVVKLLGDVRRPRFTIQALQEALALLHPVAVNALVSLSTLMFALATLLVWRACTK